MKVVKCLMIFGVMVVLVALAGNRAHGQTAKELKQMDKIFGGPWVDKKAARHLRILLDQQEGYFTINDWNSKIQNRGSGDAYKAFVKNSKLVMPAENEHYAPYSEMIVVNHKLIYITKFKDVTGKIMIDKEVFVREPW